MIPQYLFIPSQGALQGKGFILQTAAPHMMAKLYICKRESEIEDYAKKYPIHCTIEGYNVLITDFKNLDNQPIDEVTKLQVLNQMAVFFKIEKIMPNLGFYNKFIKKQ